LARLGASLTPRMPCSVQFSDMTNSMMASYNQFTMTPDHRMDRGLGASAARRPKPVAGGPPC
jgi:hypothetical protein